MLTERGERSARQRHGKEVDGEKEGCIWSRGHPGSWRSLIQGCLQGVRRENYCSVWLLHGGFFLPQLFFLPECQNIRWSSEEGCAGDGLVEQEDGRARLPGPSLEEGSRQPQPGVGGMREGQSTRNRRGGGTQTDGIEPREELHALQHFREV